MWFGGALCCALRVYFYLFKPPEDYLLENAVPLQNACENYSLPAAADIRLSVFS